MKKVSWDRAESLWLPECAGVFRVESPRALLGDGFEIEVYNHPSRGLCVWAEDYGCAHPEYYQDGHIPVQETGMNFVEFLRASSVPVE